MSGPATLAECAVEILETGDAAAKAALSRHHAARWRESVAAGDPMPRDRAKPPDRPARPARPELLDPRDVPRRRPGSPEGRIALLHAIAHIELNAVDLHWDILARFGHVPMPEGFSEDWVRAGDEEAKHFQLLSARLEALGSHYGALPAHAGMWRAAEETAEDLPARLAVVPMVLEARGLDVTPGMISTFGRAGDSESVAALETIYAEEVGHVTYGSKWFHFLCGRHDEDPKTAFHTLVRRHFGGALKPPFNEEKRAEAGLPPDFYWPLAEEASAEHR
ncbi:MAG: ferritin-like domain-containing protein [Pseudomonadota bacterium]